MKYQVVSKFRDLQTGHIYNVGDLFPHDGSEVKKARLKELASDKNKLKRVLIVEVDDSKKTETVTEKTVVNESINLLDENQTLNDPNLLDKNQASNDLSLDVNKGE